MNPIIAARIALVAIAAAASGCTTIVSKSSQVATVTSVPDGAVVSITNASGVAVHSGNTPMTVTLKKGRGYFKPEHYTVRVNKERFQPRDFDVRDEINGWYFGNIIFGGLVGMLAIDPATGAMFTLKPGTVEAALSSLNVTRNGDEQILTVVLIAGVPQDILDQLVPLASNQFIRDTKIGVESVNLSRHRPVTAYSSRVHHLLYELAKTTH